MGRLRVTFPSSDDPNALADWLELTMLLLNRTHASQTWLRRQLRTTVFPDDRGGIDDLAPTDFDIALEEVLLEVQRRKRVGGEGYPFSVEDISGGVRLYVTRRQVPYVFLLLVSTSPAMRKESRHREIDEMFDLVVAEAIKGYLGPCCQSLRFGSPASGDRPGRFSDAVPWLADQLSLPVGRGPFRGHSGDGGVDVVAWLPFDDGRLGFVVALVQCTVQLKWHKKGRDIIPDVWRGYIDFGKDPLSCLAVPFSIPMGDERWDDLRRATNVVLDRHRVARLVLPLRFGLQKQVLNWSRREAQRLGATDENWPLSN